MSPQEVSKLEDLLARLEAVVAEARDAGLGAEVQPLLARLAAGTVTVRDEGTPDAIPQRFGMIGDSEKMHTMFALLDKVAGSEVSVLIQGETGTGKELVARALHEYGSRKGKVFLAENCAAVSPMLLESELFGHKRGSFTGAIADRPGHFVAADGGTVFLDEIGDMPVEMQSKLLRTLQDGEVRPVGSNKTVKVDVRIVAATNKNLVEMCRAGTFREDLYFRLNVITIELPPLREREGDVRLLVRFYAEKLAAEMGREVRFTPAAVDALEAWQWPGNVRELENEIRRAAALTPGTIEVTDLSPRVAEGV